MIRDDNKVSIGQEVVARVDKNKLGAPKGEVATRLYFGGGFRDEWSVFDYLKEAGIITQAGAWATIPAPEGEVKTYPSKFADLIADRPDVYEHLKALAIASYHNEIPNYGRGDENANNGE